ncbi:MAG: DUF885 domain-containing protein [Alcanivoracaceae bacterium]|nr:DUF885 domain-containing protein [Alcanivoracaceae bacterium]
MKLKFILMAAVILLSACANKKTDSDTGLKSLYDNSTIALFNSRPTNATMYGIEENLAGGKFNHRLADFSPAAEAQLRTSLRTLNQQLENAKNTDDNRAVMQNLTRYFAGSEDFNIGYIDVWMGLSAFIVNQINGPLIDVPNAMITNQQINSLDDVNDYIKRLDHFDLFVEHVLAKMSADADNNWLPPEVIVNKSIATMHGFIKPTAHEHPFVTSFVDKIEKLSNLSPQQKSQLINKVKILVTTKVYPAYNNVILQLNDLLLSAPTESGIWAQPNGEAYYKDAVKMLGDTDLSPEQIHQLGLDEVTRISIEMDTILRTEGLTQGTVGQRMTAINDDPQFLYEDSDTGRENLLNDLNGYINEISAIMDSQFATRPKYAVEVRKFPKSREESAPGGMYTNPPLDGSQPGIYWINLRDIKANPKFDLKTLTYHEAIPGHHWQVALNLEQDSLPMLRRIAPYNAYVEGWALYSEKVAAEMGMYKNDPYSDLGRLKAEMFRAVRLVVDTGLHYKKWNREQAIKYMAETTGTVESDVVAEIERYMVWPGQALGYKLGMINILRLRADAKQQLGDKFEIKGFHDLVLLGGATPMSILNAKVADWIESQKP